VKQITNSSNEKDNITVVLKQKISSVSRALICAPLLYFLFTLIEMNIWNLILVIIFIPIFGFKYEYVFCRDRKSFLVLKLFKLVIYSKEKLFICPEYISLIHQSYIDKTDRIHYEYINTKFKLYVVKFFKGKEHQTVFKTTNKEEAILKANELSVVLNVRINNTLKT